MSHSITVCVIDNLLRQPAGGGSGPLRSGSGGGAA